jgi:adenosylcobinamide-phosphate guanylyltransferase
VKAIVMAGGKATRFDGEVEKALLEVGGRTLLERSVEALRLDRLSGIHVAVSNHTPRTREESRAMGVDVVDTHGIGSHQDVLELLDSFDNTFLTLNVDVPFVRRDHVARLLEAFDGRSLAAAVPASNTPVSPREESVGTDATGGRFAWVGLNIVTPGPETDIILFEDPLLAVNINDKDDLMRANLIASERGL